MKLNRTGSVWDRNERNKINDNWDKLEENTNDFQGKITDKVFAEIKDNAKLNWGEPVNSFNDLPKNTNNGDTRFTRDSGKVYRFDGKTWKEIQEIVVSPITDVENRISSQLNKIDEEQFKSSLLLHKRTRAMFVWVDDDGHKGVYTKIAPLLREYGIVMSAAIITDRPHGFPIAGLPAYDPNRMFMSYEQMKELEHEGLVEFVPHTHTHNYNHRLTDMTIDEMHEELSTNKKIMKQLGWNHKDLVYPFGAFNDKVISVVRQYFRSAFKVSGGPLLTPINQFAIDRIRVDAPATFEDIKTDIDIAFENNTLGVLTSHVDQYGNLDLNKMRKVIEYIQNRGGEFITLGEAVNEFGNVLQIGTNSISHDGKITGKDIGVYREGELDYDPNAPITDFKEGSVTRLKIRRFDMSAYNISGDLWRQGGYGIIETHRDVREDAFSFQLFINVENKTQAIRRWINDDWGEWEDFGNLIYNKKTLVNAPPNTYPQNKTTIEKIQSNVASDYDLDGAGIVYTNRDSEDVYSHQIFIPISSGLTSDGMKIRHSNSSGSAWGTWYSIPIGVNVYNRTWKNITIPAKTTVDNVTTANSATSYSFYLDRVKSTLPAGIIVKSYCWENGQLRTRISNITDAPINIPILEVSIKKVMM